MRISDFILSKQRRRVVLWKRRTMEALLLELSDNTVLLALRKARKHYREVQRLKLRSLHISTVTFNINSLSDRECLEDYRFKKQHIVMLSELIGWSGVSERKMYACGNLVSTCVFSIVFLQLFVAVMLKQGMGCFVPSSQRYSGT